MSQIPSSACLEWTRVEKKPPKNIIVKSSSIFKNNHQKSPLQIEAEKNYNDQKRIEKEVLIIGFNIEPEKDYWMQLVKTAGIDAGKIENHGCFKGQSGKFFITIRFKEKMSQELFIEKIRKTNLKISVHNRLTKFNSSVNNELQALKNSKAIFGHILEDNLFKAKLNGNSSWILIDTQQALKKFVTEASQNQKEKNRNKGEKNIQEQQELRLQICIQGFTFKPQKVSDIVTKFMQRFGLSINDVVNYNIENIDEKWEIFIQLSEKSSMRKILTSKPKKIHLSYLMGYTAGDLINPMITWKRAMTKFNEEINLLLKEARKNREIHQFEFADNRFCVKVDQFSAWVPIECKNDLHGVLKLKRQQFQLKKNASLYKANSVETMSTSMSVMSVSSGSRM